MLPMTTDEGYWETYYLRSLQRRGGVLRREDCYCRCDELLPLLAETLPAVLATAVTVLVVAAGTSEVPQVLAMEGMKVTAMDVSSSCVEAMRRVDDRVEWYHGDAFAMPEDWSETFDLVIDKGLIGHKAPEDLQCVHKLLAEYGRVLRPGGQALVVALSPMLFGAPEWRQHMVQLSGCVAYMLQKDPPDQPGWISKIQTSGREVLVHLQLTSSERQQLQLSTGTSGGASSACRARLERLDTGEVWILPLSAGCNSAKWTRDGLKLTLEDLDESMINPPWKISKSQETGEAFHCSASRLVILLKIPKSDSTRYDQMILVISVRRVENDPVNTEAALTSR